MQKSNDFHFLHPFTFRQVGVSPTEFQALPGMEVGALREKNHKARIISWTGRVSCSFPENRVIPL